MKIFGIVQTVTTSRTKSLHVGKITQFPTAKSLPDKSREKDQISCWSRSRSAGVLHLDVTADVTRPEREVRAAREKAQADTARLRAELLEVRGIRYIF